MATSETLSSLLDRLANLEPGPFPIVSLYLNLQANERGRDSFEPFLRKELDARIETYPATGPERDSLERDAARIRDFMAGQVNRSANGLALFASNGGGLFETAQVAAPIDEHELYVSPEPHLYPLARLLDEHPKYALVIADAHDARILVCAAGEVTREDAISGPKTRRHKMGGWSQARYQRHIENEHLHHAREAADALQRIVRAEAIASIVLAGDTAMLERVRESLADDVAGRIVDAVKAAKYASLAEILDAAEKAMRQQDAQTDRERVDALLDAYRASGLACVGLPATRKAFERGQVEELVIAAQRDAILPGVPSAPGSQAPDAAAGDELVAQARKTSARIRFIEDAALLAPAGGVGAFLRFKV
ncbi:MAG TPA: Vms1/Ankzf1 family peptidyl-tRNA hydrolase [Vicinamibacterales bacterium]|nr:Vms1/Ankzf1 family peptidyl-tRNA hydrolase [Vicinamibacterales bacterium]